MSSTGLDVFINGACDMAADALVKAGNGETAAMFMNVGIKTELSGELPDKGESAKIAAYAVRQCITNTIRHANGDTVYITSEKANGIYKLIITNNGTQPEADIVEKGGLKSLRQLTESAGGQMTVKSLPAFELTIIIKE